FSVNPFFLLSQNVLVLDSLSSLDNVLTEISGFEYLNNTLIAHSLLRNLYARSGYYSGIQNRKSLSAHYPNCLKNPGPIHFEIREKKG
ncbi:MAG: hypothetical protein AAFR87_29150, partial [Bacteroidota bacterium]